MATNCGIECDTDSCPCACGAWHDWKNSEINRLRAQLADAKAVIEAARRRLDVWTRQTYVELTEALADYDAKHGVK